MISNWWSKDERTLAPELEFYLNPANITCWYRYHLATGEFLLVGTGTGESGTGTTLLLVNFCIGVPVPICLVPVPLLLQLFPNTISLPNTSPKRLPSSVMIHIRSLDTNPYNNYAWNSKNLHKSKNTRTIKGTYSHTK